MSTWALAKGTLRGPPTGHLNRPGDYSGKSAPWATNPVDQRVYASHLASKNLVLTAEFHFFFVRAAQNARLAATEAHSHPSSDPVQLS